MQDEFNPHTYRDAGYNRFFSRSINSLMDVSSLSRISNQGGGNNRTLNFDQLQVSGGLGDTLRIGRIFINGAKGQIQLHSESGEEVLRLGEIDG